MNGLLHVRDLLPPERIVLDKVARGEKAVLAPQGAACPVVRAALVRHLLLGLKLIGARDACVVPLTGVRIQGARIEGVLDLSDGARPGAGLPGLVLENCDIAEPINLEGARIARLSIAGSRFRHLNARETDIDGAFDFSRACPLPDPVAPLAEGWIDLRGSIINGQLTGSGAFLQAPIPRETVRPRDRRAALWMENATVQGSVMLMDGFRAEGGVSLDAAIIRGDVWANEATVTLGEGDPFRTQGTRIGGMLVAERLVSQGMLWLLGVHIGGVLQLSGARLYGRTSDGGSEPDVDRKALIADHAVIGRTVFLTRGFVADGRVSFTEARIGGDLACVGAVINNKTANGEAIALEANSTEIADNLDLNRANIRGMVSLVGATIDGGLLVNGARLDNLTEDASGSALRAVNARIGEDAQFGRSTQADGSETPTECLGCVDMVGTAIGGNLSFRGTVLANGECDRDALALMGQRTRVQGMVEFTDKFQAMGAVVMTAAKIGGELRVDDASFSNPQLSAIYGKDIAVGNDLSLMNSIARGDIRLERAEITGSLKWEGLEIAAAAGRTITLDLRHARIGSALKAYRLSTGRRVTIDLGGMRVATIEHDWQEGWGKAERCRLKLDGLSYERIARSSMGEPALATHSSFLRRVRIRWLWPAEDRLGGQLRKWVGRQKFPVDSAESEFYPQPYRQLARVLRAQGEEDAARIITIAQRRSEPVGFVPSRVIRFIFDRFFGFGIRRRNAVATLAVYILIGGVGVWLAERNNMLVETSVVVAEVSGHPSDVKEFGAADRARYVQRAFMEIDNGQRIMVSDIACSDAARNFVDDLVYAADMLVPFIPLHQESKCEVRPDGGFGPTSWRVLRALYSVIGWVIFSLALVTFSGVLKRYEREGE
jgi:hypothetical protein